MNTSQHVQAIMGVVALLLTCGSMLNAQSEYENPWGMSKPAQTTNLAYERYPVEGFAWPTSVLPGDSIRFYVSVMNREPQSPQSQQYEMKIFRSPDFGVGQEVYSFSNATGHFYPLRAADGDSIFPGQTNKRPVDYRIGCRDFWAPTSLAFTIPDWQSGLYYVRLNHLSINQSSDYYYIPFVVRASHPGDSSKILFKFELNTFQAYNYWGGGSLYSLAQDSVTLTSDSIIAVDRPIRRDFSQSATYFTSSFEKTLRDSGYSMEYCNNIDLNDSTLGLSFVSNYNMLVLWGHDEYWSRNERTNTESFKGEQYHGNIARFAPNTCYWRISWVGSGNPYLKLKCLKDNYPSGFHPPYDLWRDVTYGPGRPEAKFLGSQYQWGWNSISGDSLTEQPPDRVYRPSHWIFKNAKLSTVGQEFGFGIDDGRRKGIVSGELDNTITNRADFPLDTLAQRYVYSHIDSTRDSVLHQMIYYEDTLTNARVFAQGAGGWILGLVNEQGSIDTDVVRMKTITMNIISHFSGKKYIGKVYTDSLNSLEWHANVELDGDVEIPLGKHLRVFSPSTVTIDSGVIFNIDGTLEINGNVTLTGSGSINVGATGQIVLVSGATLTLNTSMYAADTVTISVPSNTTLRIDSLGKIFFDTGSGLSVAGTLVVQGSSARRVVLTRSDNNNDYWSGITLNEESDATFSYCNILYAQVGINANTVIPVIGNTTVDSCKIGISMFQSAGTISNSILTHNIIKGLIIDGENPNIDGPSAAPLVTDNFITSNTTGIYITISAPILERNGIADNTSYGIWCDDGGNPFIGRNEADAPGNNIFENNGGSNLLAENYSFPFVGYAADENSEVYGGYNSFGPEKHDYDVWARQSSGAMARRNYWSEYPPEEETSFKEESEGENWIDWEFPLESYGDNPIFAGNAEVIGWKL